MLEPVPDGRQPRVRCRRCGWIGIRNAHGATEDERAARRTTQPCPRCGHMSGLLEEALRVETEPLRRIAALDQLLRELHRLAAELTRGSPGASNSRIAERPGEHPSGALGVAARGDASGRSTEGAPPERTTAPPSRPAVGRRVAAWP